jgi:Invasin, domain 3
MKYLLRSLSSAALLLTSLLLLAGCDKASPVAPSGTTLSVSANPSTVGLTGTSTITVIGRQPNGNPLNPGTEIIFSVDRGSIDPIAKIQSGGTATATFRADGRSGTAHVTATTGGSSGGGTSGSGGSTSATVDVQVGLSSGDKPTVVLSASPSSVPVNGTSTITVIARNADGSPASAGQPVILTTNLGTITPNRPVTQADGTATAKLNAGSQSGTATVSAIFGSSDVATATVTIRDAAADMLIDPQSITIPSTGGDVTFTVFVTNTQGQPFQGATVTFSTQGVPATYSGGTNIAITDTSGSAQKTLTFAQKDLVGHKSFTVTASTPGPTGTLITRTATVNVSQ